MVKERALGRAGRFHDPVEAAALKTVSVKLHERGFQDFPPRRVRGFGSFLLHDNNNTDQSVCCQPGILTNAWEWRVVNGRRQVTNGRGR
jgi:hypothetical protein